MSAVRSFSWCLSGFAPLLLLMACSGAETQDVLARQGGTSTTSASSTSSGATSSTSSSGSATSSSGSSSGATSSTSGAPAGCPEEEEPNDNRQQANVLAPARCGALTPRDNRDFLTFELQPTTKTMSINFSGRVRLRVEVGGRDAVELTPDNAGVVPFAMGEKYLIEVTPLSDSSTDIPWRVAVVER